MNTYRVYFRTDLQWCMREIVAGTPEQALALARQIANENPDDLNLHYYEACDALINEIEVCDQEHNAVAAWYDNDMRVRLAAPALLAAGERILDRWQNADIEEVIHELAIAVAQAKEGAQ